MILCILIIFHSNKTFTGLFWFAPFGASPFLFSWPQFAPPVYWGWPSDLLYSITSTWFFDGRCYVWIGQIQPSSSGLTICAESLGLLRPPCLLDFLFIWTCKSTTVGKSTLFYSNIGWMTTTDKFERLPSIIVWIVYHSSIGTIRTAVWSSHFKDFFVFAFHYWSIVIHWPPNFSAALYLFIYLSIWKTWVAQLAVPKGIYRNSNICIYKWFIWIYQRYRFTMWK